MRSQWPSLTSFHLRLQCSSSRYWALSSAPSCAFCLSYRQAIALLTWSAPRRYDLKCIIDDILNVVQQLLDGVLNETGIDGSAGFTSLSGNYLVAVCSMGPSLPVC